MIFACGNKVELPVIEVAEMTNKKVIGYETDKSRMSDTVVTSAVKEIGTALEGVLDQYEDDKFPGVHRRSSILLKTTESVWKWTMQS